MSALIALIHLRVLAAPEAEKLAIDVFGFIRSAMIPAAGHQLSAAPAQGPDFVTYSPAARQISAIRVQCAVAAAVRQWLRATGSAPSGSVAVHGGERRLPARCASATAMSMRSRR